MSKTTACAAAFLLAWSMCAPASAGPATQSPNTSGEAVSYQLNTAHTGSITLKGNFASPLKQLWSVTTGGDITLSYPVIADGKMFVTGNHVQDDNSQALAFDLTNGKIAWNKLLTGTAFGMQGPAYDKGRIFINDGAGLVTAIAAKSGKIDWSTQLEFEYYFNTPPVAVNGAVYSAGYEEGGELYALNEANGAALWSKPLIMGAGSTPAFGDNGIYVTYQCNYYKFDPAKGSVDWYDSNSGVAITGPTPVYFNNSLFVADSSGCGNVVLDPGTGAALGSFPVADSMPAFFTGSNGDPLDVYLSNDSLICWDIATGKTLWTYAGGNTDLQGSPIVVNGTIFIGSFYGDVVALDENGNLLYTATTTMGPINYLGAGEGTLIAIGSIGITAFGPG